MDTNYGNGIRYELISKAIFEQILNEQGGSQFQILSVTANITITPAPKLSRPLLPPEFVAFVLKKSSKSYGVKTEP